MTFLTPLYIGLGSNLGDSVNILKLAIRDIVQYTPQSLGASSPIPFSVSPLYRSRAIEVLDNQPDYWNAVMCLDYSAGALECDTTDPTIAALRILKLLQCIESKAGRIRKGFHASRTLDLDLLLFDQLTCNLPTLQLPHPGIAHRLFVLKPLSDLKANLMVPSVGVVSTLLQQLLEQKDIGITQPIECVFPGGWEQTP